MPLVPSFTVAPTSNPAALLLTDTSTGSDVAVVDRQILIFNAAGTPITGSPFDWPIADPSITIAPLQADQALNIQVNWNNSSAVALYTKSQLFAAEQYAQQFEYSLIQQMAATTNLSILNDFQFFQNLSKLQTLIDSASRAIVTGADVFSSQFCISLYQQLLNNPNLYF